LSDRRYWAGPISSSLFNGWLVIYSHYRARAGEPRVSNATIAQIKFNSARGAHFYGGPRPETIRHLDCSSARVARPPATLSDDPDVLYATQGVADPRRYRRRLFDEISTTPIDFLIDILLSRVGGPTACRDLSSSIGDSLVSRQNRRRAASVTSRAVLIPETPLSADTPEYCVRCSSPMFSSIRASW